MKITEITAHALSFPVSEVPAAQRFLARKLVLETPKRKIRCKIPC
jgi:hypothetical protein